MAYVKTTGIILKRNKSGENDAFLTVFTDSLGVISVSAKGIKSMKNKSFAGASLFSLSEFLLKPAGDIYYLVSASLISSFYSLSSNIERLAFATYIAELSIFCFKDNEPDASVLALICNTFYLLSNYQGNLRKIKTVYEIKLLHYLGTGIASSECILCGKTDGLCYFTNEGGALCADCHTKKADAVKVSNSALMAFTYITNSENKKAFSFEITKKALGELESLTDGFIKRHIGKSFASLDYLYTILGKDTEYELR